MFVGIWSNVILAFLEAKITIFYDQPVFSDTTIQVRGLFQYLKTTTAFMALYRAWLTFVAWLNRTA